MVPINAASLFREIEKKVPLSLALEGDPVGYTGTRDAEKLEVERILVMMDYISPGSGDETDYDGYDLLILHHPPLTEPDIPAYVIHSNWDIIEGGASDALAEWLDIKTDEIFDRKTGIGRIGTLKEGPLKLPEFCDLVMERLGLNEIRTVNLDKDIETDKICLVPGFGLNPGYIQLAHEKGAGIYLSGDLTHRGAVTAKNSGLVLIDASHHNTEIPGLYRLWELISEIGIETEITDTGTPWKNYIHVPEGKI